MAFHCPGAHLRPSAPCPAVGSFGVCKLRWRAGHVSWQVQAEMQASCVQAMNFSGEELDILQRFSQAALDTDEDWSQDNVS